MRALMGIVMRILCILILAVAGSAQTEKERAFALNERGVVQYQAKEYDKAVELFEEAYRLDPKGKTVKENLARALHGRAHGRLGKGEIEDALRDLGRAIEFDDREPAFKVMYADALLRKLDDRSARSFLIKAIKEHSTTAGLFEMMGRLEYREEFLEEALIAFETAANLDPERKKRLQPMIDKVRRELKVEGGFFKDMRGQFIVKYDDKGFRDVGRSVLDLLDKAYNRIAIDFGRWPKERLTVVLYTRNDYSDATGAHSWTGGLFDGKIRLPVRNWRHAESDIVRTLDHELTHWFVRGVTRRCPLWLNEGMAQLQEGQQVGAVTRGRLLGAIADDRYTKMSKLPQSWSKIKNRDTVTLYYAQSLHFTEFLVKRYGWPDLAALLSDLSAGQSFEASFEARFKVELSRVEEDWLSGLR